MKIDTKTGRFLQVDISGRRFDRLLVIGPSHRDNMRRMMWKCVCDCGNEIVRRADYILLGKNQSCGCLAREISRATRKRLQTTHGLSSTPTGNSWMAMMDRCFNPKSKDWKRYGGAGRTVCEFLRATPLNSILLIGERPSGTSLDRTNNSGFYTCGKCAECLSKNWAFNIRWATPKMQASNK